MIYRALIRPLLFALSRQDPEVAHEWAMSVLVFVESHPRFTSLWRWHTIVRRPCLRQKVAGLTFPSPLGLGAGFDKNALFPTALASLGFGFIEVGTITPLPQPGNPRPRTRRLPEERALLNRMGFNNNGAVVVAERRRASPIPPVPLGISLGRGKDTPNSEAANDYCLVLRQLFDYGHFFTINISSPNTPGLRDLQGRKFLSKLLRAVQRTGMYLADDHRCPPKPLFLKLAPDISDDQLVAAIDVAMASGISGLILANTRAVTDEQGVGWGLSGPDLFDRALTMVKLAHQHTGGQLPIIGVGGIDTPDRAEAMLDAGASLIQILTSLIYQGPLLPRRINRHLSRLRVKKALLSVASPGLLRRCLANLL